MKQAKLYLLSITVLKSSSSGTILHDVVKYYSFAGRVLANLICYNTVLKLLTYQHIRWMNREWSRGKGVHYTYNKVKNVNKRIRRRCVLVLDSALSLSLCISYILEVRWGSYVCVRSFERMNALHHSMRGEEREFQLITTKHESKALTKLSQRTEI